MTVVVVPDLWRAIARHVSVWREAWRAETARPRQGLQGAEQEFLPAAIEIMERPASPLGRGLIWSLCSLFAIALGWSILGHLDIVAAAQGKVIAQGHTKSIQALEIGVVRAIHVRDGERVLAGQRLIDLDPTDASADHDRMERERTARLLDEARLDSLLEGGPEQSPMQLPSNVDPVLREATRRQLESQWREKSTKLAVLDHEVEQRVAELRMAEADVERLKAVIPLLKDRSDSLAGLAAQGYTSRIHASEVQQQLIEGEKNLIGARDKVQQAGAALRVVQRQRLGAEQESESSWRKERAEAIEKRAAAEQEIVKARKRRDLQSLASPIDGTVANLAAFTVGGIIKAGDTVLNIVPLSAAPEIEAQVLNKDIGFVLPGQRVSVKLEAFPFTRYGTIGGEVIDISRDSNKDEKLGLIYPVLVRLDAAEINVDGKTMPITPGMSVTAEIITGNRRLIEYVLSPVMKYRHEAGRER